MVRLLVVAHCPTDQVGALRDAVVEGASHPDLVDHVEVEVLAPLDGTEQDLRDADGYVLVTPVNFGAMAGALKHLFDHTFRALEGEIAGRPYGVVVKGTTDASGAVRGIRAIATGLGWREAAEPLAIEGDVDGAVLATARSLGSTVAATLLT